MIRNRKYTWTKGMAGAVAGLVIMLLAVEPAAAVEPTPGKAKLEQLAKAASTPEQHAAVAKHYRVWAENLDAKAASHEQEAAKLAKLPLPAMAHKWPAMVSNPAAKEKQLAIQTRRAAHEARVLAQRHLSLSVEAREAE